MRVAYVCADPGVPVFGRKGCSIHVQAVLREMVAVGCEVILFARRLGGDFPRDLQGVEVVQLPTVKRTTSAEREVDLANGNRGLRLKMERQPRFDLVYERYALWSHAAMQFAADHQVPAVLEVNAPLVAEQSRHRELIDGERARQISASAFSHASVLLAVSEGVADQILAEIGPQADSRLHVVPNGVTPQHFETTRNQIAARQASADVASGLVVGFVGTMRAWHGMATLGAAFSQLVEHVPAARLLIVGDGTARAELESQLSPAAQAAVTITGAVDHSAVPELMAQMDVAVAPYLPADNFYFSPLKVMEYLAAGLPVVCSDASTFGSLLDEHNAQFFAAGDAAGLANVLLRLSEDPPLRRQLSQAAFDSLQSEHTWQGVLQKTFDLAGVGTPRFARSVG